MVLSRQQLININRLNRRQQEQAQRLQQDLSKINIERKYTQGIEELKRKNAEEGEKQITDLIKQYQQTIDTYNLQYQQATSSSQADYADRRRTEAEYKLSELNRALGLARSGEYAPQDLVSSALQRGSIKSTLGEQSAQLRKELEKQRVNIPQEVQQVTSAQFSRTGGIGGLILIREGGGETRRATEEDFRKYGVSKEQIIRETPSQSSIQKSTPKDIFTTAGEIYKTSNVFVSEKITKPILTPYQETIKKIQEGVSGFGRIAESVTSPIRKGVETITPVTTFLTTPIREGTKLVMGGQKGYSQFLSGASEGVITDIKEEPVKNVLLFGAGRVVGAVAPAVVSGVQRVSPFAGSVVKGGVALGGVAGGGVMVYQTGGEIIKAQSPYEVGRTAGIVTKDVLLLSAGGKIGKRDYEKISGWLSTRGREYLPTKQGVYPQVPRGKQLDAFQKNIIKELNSERAGAFHTTSQPLRTTAGILTPETGRSEFAGLYGSTQVSKMFARISGSETGGFSVFGSLTSTNKPAIAYLVPDKFRNVVYEIARSPFFKGQKSISKGKEKLYVNIVDAPVKGVADVPALKTEIEAVFRPESGSYKFVSGKYYTTIDRIKVPIDTFEPMSLETNVMITPATETGFSLIGGRSSYSLPSSKSPFISEATGLLGISSSKNIPSSSVSTPPSKVYSAVDSPVSKMFSDFTSGIPSPSIPSYPKTPFSPTSFISSISKKPRSDFIPSVPPSRKRRTTTPIIPEVRKRFEQPNKKPAKKILEDMFEIFKKERGKFVKIGEAETKFLAGQRLKKGLLETLSASGYVEKKGKKVAFEELGISGFAQPSKRKGFGFLAVQRIKSPLFSGRLTSFGERREIQRARKKKRFDWLS